MPDMYDLRDDGDWMKSEPAPVAVEAPAPRSWGTRVREVAKDVGTLLRMAAIVAVAIVALSALIFGLMWLEHTVQVFSNAWNVAVGALGVYWSFGLLAKLSVVSIVAGLTFSTIALFASDRSDALAAFVFITVLPHVLVGVPWVIISAIRWLWAHPLF